MQQRFRELDGLRGVAALAVVGTHFTNGFDSRNPELEPALFDLSVGAFGVQLFFIISGFVILLSARRATRPSDFVISRVSRLYPAYWISLLVLAALVWMLSIEHFKISLWEMALNFTMIQRWLLVPNFNEVSWTLAVEMQFYFIILLLLWVTRSNLTDRVVTNLASAWLVVSVVVAVIAHPYASGVNPQLVALPVRLLLNATLAEFGPLFILGMLIFVSRQNEKLHKLLPLAAVIATLNAWLLHGVYEAIVVAAIVLVFLVVAFRKRTAVLLLPPLLWLGKISYSLYIIHLIPGEIVIDLVRPFVGRDWAMLPALGVVVLLAWGLHVVGERYASRWFKTVLEAWRRAIDARRDARSKRRASVGR